jgi:hypothetical protein
VKESERLTMTLQGLLTDLEVRGDQVIEEQCAKMVESLRGVAQGFSEHECEKLRNALAEGHRGRVWNSDATPLQQDLEKEFLKHCREAEQKVVKLATSVFPKLKELLARYRPDWPVLDQVIGGDKSARMPSLPTINLKFVLEFEWWNSWLSSERNLEGRVAELDRLIKREIEPIVDGLAVSARTQLKARHATLLEEGQVIFVGAVELLTQLAQARLERTRALINGIDTPETKRARDARPAELKGQADKMAALVQKLEGVEQSWAELTG